MTKIDIISGFLGAGKTTFIKKMLKEAFSGEQVVLIENEFGEIGIDGGFLKEAGIEIREMNSGCICCSLVGDFGKSLKEVVDTYHPDRILIEPSGVGKLSDVIKAVQDVQDEIEAELNSFTTVVDVTKCRLYKKNFGEFFSNQIEYAGAIILSRTDKAKPEKSLTRQILETVGDHAIHYKSCILESDSWQLLTMVIYQVKDGASQKERFEKYVVPMVCSQLETPVVCFWKTVERLLDMPSALQEIRVQREWNLMFPKGTLISNELIEQQHPVPLKYPVELEEKAKQAVLQENKKELKKCFWELANCYQEEFHTPTDIKQAIIHLSLAVFGIYKAKVSVELDLEVQNILQEITVAVSWNQLEAALKAFFGLFEFETEEEGEETSVLVKQAKKLIRKYYDQGITLEEIANKLYVSEEYLSAQFKKETGSTFTETIRKYRIEKVKELLLNTHLKLNQIAELAGYSDPKYMSKVFKEEVGMLPNDFRKSVH